MNTAITELRANLRLSTKQLPAGWQQRKPNTKAKKDGGDREIIARYTLQIMEQNSCSQAAAIASLRVALETGNAPLAVINACQSRARDGELCPHKASIGRWILAYTNDKPLTSKYRGRELKPQPWHAAAVEYFQLSSKPKVGTVYNWLTREGHELSYDQLRRLYKALPTNVTIYSAKRLGHHYHSQNVKSYVRRTTEKVAPGLIYEADGHRLDLYIRHPNDGSRWRPEITAIMDIRSHYLVGWYISSDESAITTLYALSHAIDKHQHVPAAIHVDNGPGFVNKMLAADTSGFLKRLDVELMKAIPGNAKGKGLTEGFFGHFAENVCKRFPAYIGKSRTDDHRLIQRIDSGAIPMCSLEVLRDEINAYAHWYNHKPQKNLGCAPAELWEQKNRINPELTLHELLLPRELRLVRRRAVRIHNRVYDAPELTYYEGQQISIAYNLHNEQEYYAHDLNDNYICPLKLISKKDWTTESHIQDLARNTEAGQIKRLDKQKARKLSQNRAPIEATAEVERLDSVLPDPETDNQADSKLPKIDIYDLL